VGQPEALKAWVAYWQSEERESILCYNTARCIKDYLRLVAKCAADGVPLPTPDVLITGDGTEVRWRSPASQRGDVFLLDRIWFRRMEGQWRKSGADVKVQAAMDALDAGRISALNDVDNSPPRGEFRYAITVMGEAEALAVALALQRAFGPEVFAYTMAGWDEEPVPQLVAALPSFATKVRDDVRARLASRPPPNLPLTSKREIFTGQRGLVRARDTRREAF
jgi:hypothetical protein